MDRKEIAEQFYMEEHAVLYALLVKAAQELYGDKGLANVEGTIQYGRGRDAAWPCAHSGRGRPLPQNYLAEYSEWVDDRKWSKRMSMPSPCIPPPTAPTAAGVRAGKTWPAGVWQPVIVPTSTSI